MRHILYNEMMRDMWNADRVVYAYCVASFLNFEARACTSGLAGRLKKFGAIFGELCLQ